MPGGSAISSRGQTSFFAIAVVKCFAFDKKAASGPNSAISLTQTFDRVSFCVYNSLYFGVQKAKNGDRGTIVFTATLTELFTYDVLLYIRLLFEYCFHLNSGTVHPDIVNRNRKRAPLTQQSTVREEFIEKSAR